jgi:predicted dehydrogenase
MRIAAGLALLLMALPTWAAEPAPVPVRLAIVGLVHGHVRGFLDRLKGRTDVELVGVVDPDASLRESYRERYALAPEIFHGTVEAMLDAARPQAVAIFTSTYDHPQVVEACATRGVHVMMEKPLAVSTAHGRRNAEAAARGRIQVLVNYETTWYASNRAVFDAVKEGTLGPVRK